MQPEKSQAHALNETNNRIMASLRVIIEFKQAVNCPAKNLVLE